MVLALQYDPDDLRERVQSGQTHKEIAEDFGCSVSWVERKCMKHDFRSPFGTGPRRGEKHFCWRGGTKISKGYRYLYRIDHPHCTKQGYVSEHRLVMEKKLGRYLDPKEVVHHIDKDRLNNEPENLLLFASNADHLRSELTGHCPKWTPEGKAALKAAIDRRSPPRTKLYGPLNPRILRALSGRGNTDEGPAS